MTLHNHASCIHCLHLLELPPWEILKSSCPFVCHIVSDVSQAEDAELLTAVTSTSSPQQCLMCQASNHLFSDCPKILDLDSNTCCVVFSSLLRVHGPSQLQTRPSTSPHSPQIQHIHAVIADDTSTPFDESALDFASSTDDSNILEEIESHPEF